MRKAHFLAFHHTQAARSSLPRSPGCASSGVGSSTISPSSAIQAVKASCCCTQGGMSR